MSCQAATRSPPTPCSLPTTGQAKLDVPWCTWRPGKLSLHYVPTKLQRADVLTKIQPRPGHEQSCAQFAFDLPANLEHAQLERYDGVPGPGAGGPLSARS